MALRAAATARAAGVESGAAIEAPACTVVFGVMAGACIEETLAGVALVNGALVVEVEVDGAGALPVTGTRVPSACKTNLAGPVASAGCADAGGAG